MPHRNNDKFDELFQKAGDNYPLKTDNSSWNSVFSKLSDTAKEAALAKQKRLIKYAAILLLLSISIVGFYKFKSPTIASKSINNVSEKIAQKLNVDKQPSKVNVELRAAKEDQHAEELMFYSETTSNNPEFASTNNKQIAHSTEEQKKASVSNILSRPLNQQPIDIDKIASADPNPNNKLQNNSLNSIRQAVKLRTQAKFYGTFYGSPEFSMIKFQRVANPGYKLGVALGYRINKRFDIELGLQREHINFYTEGKYFDISVFPIKEGEKLENVRSKSKITSVPIAIKYKFLSKNSGRFYVSAGFNAVQITHTEKYDFSVLKRNGIENNRSKKYASMTGPKYFTGIIAAGGYETKVCNLFGMKIEPYYQMPLQKSSVGNLFVTSFGINIGIVKDLR